MSDDRRFYIAILAGVVVGAVLIGIGEFVEWLKRRTQDAMLYETPDLTELTRQEKANRAIREEMRRTMRIISTHRSPCCYAALNADGEGLWSEEDDDYTVRVTVFTCSKCGNEVEFDE